MSTGKEYGDNRRGGNYRDRYKPTNYLCKNLHRRLSIHPITFS